MSSPTAQTSAVSWKNTILAVQQASVSPCLRIRGDARLQTPRLVFDYRDVRESRDAADVAPPASILAWLSATNCGLMLFLKNVSYGGLFGSSGLGEQFRIW